MKCCVFGGSGFIGSHVADHLSEISESVLILDIHQKKNLLPNQKFKYCDITNFKDLESIFNENEFDYVYNFSGIADIDEAQKNPIGTIECNILGNSYILELIKNKHVKKYIFASSIYVYSRSGGFYRCSKQACENYIEEYHKQYGIQYNNLRFGSLYGSGANSFNGVSKFILSAIKNEPIVYYGNGEEERDYINIKDAARLSVRILDEKYNNKNLILTGNQKLKIKSLFLMLEEIFQKKLIIDYKNNNHSHYSLTPYSYIPKEGFKISDELNIDLGQGLMQCVEDLSVYIQ